MNCINCNSIEEYNGYDDSSIEYLCGTCVQNYLSFSEEELESGYLLALEMDLPHKADIIAMFVDVNNTTTVMEETNGTDRHERHTDRGRVVRNVRD